MVGLEGYSGYRGRIGTTGHVRYRGIPDLEGV